MQVPGPGLARSSIDVFSVLLFVDVFDVARVVDLLEPHGCTVDGEACITARNGQLATGVPVPVDRQRGVIAVGENFVFVLSSCFV